MSKTTVLLLIFILLVSTLLGSSILTRGHFWGDDFAAYIMQAKSILAGNMGDFVIANTFTVMQSSQQIGPAAYPWGFPLILVPVHGLFGLSPLALKLPGLLAYLAFLVIFFFLANRRFTLFESLLAVSLFAFNPELLRFLDNILSDIPFLFFSTLAILLADIYIHETQKKRCLALAAGTGVVIFASFFIRTQGLILLGSMLLFQLITFLRKREQRRNIVAETLVIIVAFSMLWGLSTLIFPGGQSSYLAIYAGFNTDLFIDNISYYSKIFSQFFTPLPGESILFGMFVAFYFIGLVARFKDDLFFVLYTALYHVVLWSWPERQGYRFIFPMLPFFIYFSFQGIFFMLRRIPKTHTLLSKKIVYTLLMFTSFAFLFTSSKNALLNLRSGRDINGPFDSVSMETFEFIRNETSPDSVIVFFKPRAMRLMTDRDALALTECDRIPEGDYLALSKKVGDNLQIPPEHIDECTLQLEKEFENRRFIVYQILK